MGIVWGLMLGVWVSWGVECFKDSRDLQEAVHAKKINDSELLGRLVHAEGTSANSSGHPRCAPWESQLRQAIAWGVRNRVEMAAFDPRWAYKYGAGYSGVIFKKGQFNPAVSPKSRFAALMACPGLDAEQAFKIARAVVEAPRQQNPFLESRETSQWERKHLISLVNQFYYPLSEQATAEPPSWTRAPRVSVLSIPTECIWFFKNERPLAAPRLVRPLLK